VSDISLVVSSEALEDTFFTRYHWLSAHTEICKNYLRRCGISDEIIGGKNIITIYITEINSSMLDLYKPANKFKSSASTP
jgi:hypothetical protein